MRIHALILTLGLLCITLLPLSAHPQKHAIDESSSASYIFVMSGKSGSVKGNTLVLKGVPSVIYFSDRPARIAGHMSVKAFGKIWSRGPNSFAANPPNAALSILRSGRVKNTIIELTSFKSKGDTVQLGFTIVNGRIPKGAFGPASLFIDCIGLITPCSNH